MGKTVKAITNVATLGLSDSMDVFGDKAAAAQKDAAEQAARDAAALAGTSSSDPTLNSESVTAAREAERQRKLALAGQNSTILTSAQGATGSTSGAKSLLGS